MIGRMLLLVLSLAASLSAQRDPESPWYLERGTAPRPAEELDAVVRTALDLATLLRDGGVPGFYDGQFALLEGRFDELVAVAHDPAMNHVLRVMAVMALAEAGDGEPLREALVPLIIAPNTEFNIEHQASASWNDTADEDWVRRQLAADLSVHARFALAKDGQPEQVLAKIEVMELYVRRNLSRLLDRSIKSEYDPTVLFGRQVMFDIAYHFQQYDDYDSAREWFRRLTDNLPGHRDAAMAHYNLACIEALNDQPDAAVVHLREAYDVGFTDVAWMEEDGDLQSLRERPEFRELAAEMRNEPPANPSAGQGKEADAP